MRLSLQEMHFYFVSCFTCLKVYSTHKYTTGESSSIKFKFHSVHRGDEEKILFETKLVNKIIR